MSFFKHKHKWKPIDAVYVKGKGMYMVETCVRCWKHCYHQIMHKQALIEWEEKQDD